MAEPPNPRSKWRMENATGKTDPWDHQIRNGELRVKRLVQITELGSIGGSSGCARLTSNGGVVEGAGKDGARAESWFVIVKLVSRRSGQSCRNQFCAYTVKAKAGCKGVMAALNEGRANHGGCSCCKLRKYRQKKNRLLKASQKCLDLNVEVMEC